MTGIVVVSHSRALADAAVALASEMVHGTQARILVAAGLDATTFGTDAAAIVEAVIAADDGAGVVVLMDLGSAVLSAELALDLIDVSLRDRVVLCPAPLVEGLVVAAVAAAGGAGPAEVAAEAVGSLAAKQSHVGVSTPPLAGDGFAGATGDGAGDAPSATAAFDVLNHHGLHARPAARLVQEARLFDARIQLRNLTTGAGPVPATSLSKVATLGVLRGHRVEVSASGSQAPEALDHVLALAARRFDEQETADVEPSRASPSDGLSSDKPLPASPGIALGPALALSSADVVIPDEVAVDPSAEWRRVREAVAHVRREIQRVRARAARDVGEAEARIFDAHLMFIDDAHLLDEAHARVNAGAAAARAWVDAVEGVEAELAALEDPYLRGRAADVRAVGQQVARALVGTAEFRIEGEGVLIADDLSPAQVADLDTTRVRGIVLASGSPSGHSAILARSRAIPAVVAAGPSVLAVPTGTMLALDGGTGEVFVDPSAEVLADLQHRDETARAKSATARAAAKAPALTRDGVEILVGANLGSVEDAVAAAGSGADLSGLVRTEFVFLARDHAPDVDEQVEIYRQLASALGGRRLTLRTLDVGGDKPLAYAPQPAEANPFLGVRGIRFALAQHDLLKDQLAAMVKVAHETPISVMFPMVSSVEELAEARRWLDEAITDEGRGRPVGLDVGIMVEVPSTALKARAFVPYVDFFSIGTNDLTQYTMAAERGNPAVAGLADPVDPGVLRLIDSVCRAAGDHTLVAVCGELAADEQVTPLLVALGVRELSTAPMAVPGVKQAVREIATASNSELVQQCLSAAGSADVRAILR
jgi:phosphoenolpyruvate-protein phosphotransferase/dihydroxyacetone kinase phosphotransfer subunit